MKRGFTLIELSAVLAGMALVVGLTVPVYRSLVLRAHSDEARTMLPAIAHAELRYHRDHGQYLACGAEPVAPTLPVHFPAELPCWTALGISPSGDVRYGYAVT